MAQLNLGAIRLILLLLPLFLIHSSHGAVLNNPAIVERQFRGGDFQRGGGNQQAGGNQGGNQGGGNQRGGNNQIWLTYDQWNALNIQNSYRQGRNLRPLVWDRILQQDAQNWANHLAYIDQMVHASPQQRGSEGENLAWIRYAVQSHNDPIEYKLIPDFPLSQWRQQSTECFGKHVDGRIQGLLGPNHPKWKL